MTMVGSILWFSRTSMFSGGEKTSKKSSSNQEKDKTENRTVRSAARTDAQREQGQRSSTGMTVGMDEVVHEKHLHEGGKAHASLSMSSS
jgi:hypothetical protein